jgi:TolB protein
MKPHLLIPLAISIAFINTFCGDSDTSPVIKSADSQEDSVHPLSAIAYIRNGSEIRLIDSNGQHDHQIWTHPDAKEPLGLFGLSWRPDGKELAFSSAHEAVTSLYEADIYAVRPDGSGFRKITNAPAHSELNKYKKGTVTVVVRNNQYSFQAAQSSAGIFFINIIGSEEPQQITLPPGSSKTIVFKNVADYGNHAQPLVAIYGNYRWFMPGTDVVAGKTIKAPDFLISGDGIPMFGAYRPIWKQDGSRISYRNGLCLIQTKSSKPEEGDLKINPLYGGKNPMGTCVWDWGPTSFLSNQILYAENEEGDGSGIFLLKEGGEHKDAVRQTLFSDIQYQLLNELRWMPDGTGFLYSTVDLFRESSNIFYYDFKTKEKKQLTQLKNEFARRFCISPSGKWIVFEKSKTADEFEDIDLWIMRIDGSGARLLVKNGWSPSWSK